MSFKRRGDTYDHPEDERETDDASEQAVLAEPCAKASFVPETTPGIGTAPARQAAAPGEHVLDMHHEVLVRELALALLVSEFVLERAFRRLDLARPRYSRLDNGPCRRLLSRRLDGRGRG